MIAILPILFFAIISLIVPFNAHAQNPTGTSPTQTSPPQCLDFNLDKICESIVLANGTMVPNPLVRNVTVDSIAASSHIALLPENGTTITTVLRNGTIVQNSTVQETEIMNEDLCYKGGFSDGMNNPFNHRAEYNEIQDKECTKLGHAGLYFNAFIEGCMAVGANRTVCETATEPEPAPMTQIAKPVKNDCYAMGYKDAMNGPVVQSTHLKCGSEFERAFMDQCLEWNPKELCIQWHGSTFNQTQTPSPITQGQNLVCQSNDDFCTPGCEHADMQCIDEENDDNRNGVRDSEENQGSSSNNNNNDREEKTYCDVPNPSNPCHDRRDGDEITGLYTCMDGSHEEDWKDCNGDKEYPNCNDVEYGTRCDGTEDEDSWTDEEAAEEN